ncbi:hypothetical protein P7K49_032664, partial [Saguinus oedipus]
RELCRGSPSPRHPGTVKPVDWAAWLRFLHARQEPGKGPFLPCEHGTGSEPFSTLSQGRA